MYKTLIENDIRKIQRRRRKEFLTYREAVKKAPHKPSCTRYVLTHGFKFHHVTSFLGMKPIIATTNIRDLRPNNCIQVIEVETNHRLNCVVRRVEEFRHYGLFPESRGIIQDLIIGNKFCYEIDLAKKSPGYFNYNGASQSLLKVSRAQTAVYRPDLKYSLKEYPYRASIICFVDKDGEIIEFANGNKLVNYILVKK
jgi:hypothetical protein